MGIIFYFNMNFATLALVAIVSVDACDTMDKELTGDVKCTCKEDDPKDCLSKAGVTAFTWTAPAAPTAAEEKKIKEEEAKMTAEEKAAAKKTAEKEKATLKADVAAAKKKFDDCWKADGIDAAC